jgi:hypothetical protein
MPIQQQRLTIGNSTPPVVKELADQAGTQPNKGQSETKNEDVAVASEYPSDFRSVV